jgi:hypothetical protein
MIQVNNNAQSTAVTASQATSAAAPTALGITPQNIEFMVMALFADMAGTTQQQMQTEVAGARNKLNQQKELNNALATIDAMKTGYTDTNAATQRSTTAGGISAADATAIQVAVDAKPAGTTYTAMVSGMQGISADAKNQFLARAVVADLAQMNGVVTQGAFSDLNSLVAGGVTQGFMDGTRTKLKAVMDSLASDSQLLMLSIQNIKQKSDTATQALTSLISSSGQSKKGIAQGMGA